MQDCCWLTKACKWDAQLLKLLGDWRSLFCTKTSSAPCIFMKSSKSRIFMSASQPKSKPANVTFRKIYVQMRVGAAIKRRLNAHSSAKMCGNATPKLCLGTPLYKLICVL